MIFEWDEAKSGVNQSKHGISFNQAIRIFDDPAALIAPDVKHSHKEQRHWIIGATETDKVLVVIYTIRFHKIRLISARRANRKEVGAYEKSKNISI